MDDVETLRKILIEVGDADDAVETVMQVGAAAWYVETGEIGIEIDLDVEGRLVTLYGAIGTPTEARRLEVCEMLLVYSMLSRQTGGVRAAVDQPGGRLVLIVDFGIEGLTARLCRNVLHDFAGKAASWRAFVTAEGIAPPVSPLNDFVRV